MQKLFLSFPFCSFLFLSVPLCPDGVSFPQLMFVVTQLPMTFRKVLVFRVEIQAGRCLQCFFNLLIGVDLTCAVGPKEQMCVILIKQFHQEITSEMRVLYLVRFDETLGAILCRV